MQTDQLTGTTDRNNRPFCPYTEPLETVGTKKELGINSDTRNPWKGLSWLQSGTSGISGFSEGILDTKSSIITRRKK